MEQLSTSAHIVSTTSSPLAGGRNEDLASIIVLSICFLVGVPGNAGVMMVLRQNNQLSSLSRSLMLSLAVSDLLCLATLPAWIYGYLHSWNIGVALCKCFGFLAYWSAYSSLLNVTALSLQRYFHVALPQRMGRLGLAGQRALLAVIWVCAACIASPHLVVRQLLIRKVSDMQWLECDTLFSSDRQRITVRLIEVILGFVVPLSAMMSAYICLHRRANQSVFFNSPRMTRLITSIIVTFIVFWTPLQLINMLGVAGMLLGNEVLLKIYFQSRPLVTALTVLNSVSDPFLYAFASRNRGTGRQVVT